MPEREKLALPGRGPELGVWRPWNPGIGGLGPVWPGLGRFPGLADFGVLETPNFPLLPGYRKTRFWGPPTGNSRNSVEFSKKQQKTAYFPLLQANSGVYPPKQGNAWVREDNSGVPGRGRRILGSGTPESGIALDLCISRKSADFPVFSVLADLDVFPDFVFFWHLPGIRQFQEIRGRPRLPDSGRLPEFGVWADSGQMLE